MFDGLKLGDRVFSSRLLLGTGMFSDTDTMIRAVRASETALVTVALRRFHPGRPLDDIFEPLASLDGITLVPNTSGAMNAKEAIRAALLGAGRDAWRAGLMPKSELATATSPLTAFLAGGTG